MLLITRVSFGFNFLSSLRYPGLAKSFPDCLSMTRFFSAMPNSRIAITCLSSFWSREDTRM